ncbi:MAG: hypothetical protein JOY82_22075 [Streptosporangiaceae bacterium]|nr:hypothetical protein [Streptosporangiaceae bacterium]MBV9857172.1 hypothetical protein [Streptosporangiaceae bacterium]
MTDLPPKIAERYRRAAQQNRLLPETAAAILRAAARYRRLDEGSGPRGYYERTDEEGLDDKGGRWLWETVTVDTKIIAVKQIEVTSDGAVRRYSWRWLHDRDGFLTDQPLYPEEEGLHLITRDRFYEVWDPA